MSVKKLADMNFMVCPFYAELKLMSVLFKQNRIRRNAQNLRAVYALIFLIPSLVDFGFVRKNSLQMKFIVHIISEKRIFKLCDTRCLRV